MPRTLLASACLFPSLIFLLLVSSLLRASSRPFAGSPSIQDVQRRKMPALQKLQARPAAGADVADLVGQAELLDRGGTVAAADDAGGAVALRGLDHRLGDGPGPGLEGLLLEHAHRAVPDDRLGLQNLAL